MFFTEKDPHLDALEFFYSYLTRRKQNVKINNTHSVFQILLSGVPQGSILGPLLGSILCSIHKFINYYISGYQKQTC